MKKINIDLAVGVFMILGIFCLGYISVKLGKMEVIGSRGYQLVAVFSNSGGIKPGAVVTAAGVQIGRVKSVTLEDYEARIVLEINRGVQIPDDSMAAIKTQGLIGEKLIEVTPGADEAMLKPGEKIRDTQPPVDLEALIAKYMFGKV